MIGHHLTPTANVESILATGLRPARTLRSYDVTTPVVWLWRDLFTCPDEDLTARVFQRCIDHQTWDITALEVQYDEADLIGKPATWNVRHRQTLSGRKGDWLLHDDVLVHCVVVPIPPSDLRVITQWDMARLVSSLALPAAFCAAPPR